jgi:hypothetical protein
MGLPGADAWELAGFPGRLKVAAYLTADQVAAQYCVLVDVLLDAQEHSLTGVGRAELLAAVRERIAAATDTHTVERLTRKQIIFDYLGTETGQVRRGRVAPVGRAHLRAWSARFPGREDVAFAVEGCAGWQYVARGAGCGRHRGASGRVGGHRVRPRPQAARQDR